MLKLNNVDIVQSIHTYAAVNAYGRYEIDIKFNIKSNITNT